MFDHALERILENRLPKSQRRDAFKWIDKDDREFSSLDAKRRKWMKNLKTDGARFLADLFFQSKPKIESHPPNEIATRVGLAAEDFATLKEQLVPSLSEKYRQLKDQDKMKLNEFVSLV